MDRRTLLGTIGTVAFGTGLSGCLDGNGRGGGDPPADLRGVVAEAELHENLAVPESSLYRGEAGFGVRGRVENVGDRPMTNVEVHVRLLDPDDGLVGEFYDDHADEQELWRLAPGEAVEFDVRFEDTEPAEVEEAVRYEVWATGTVE